MRVDRPRASTGQHINFTRKTQKAWAYETVPGNLGVLTLAGSLGKLVHVLRRVDEVDMSAVSSSIDGDPWFAHDAEPRNRKWHVVRIHHRCRSMGSSEACCERVGSVMRQYSWNPQRHTNGSVLMDNVLLAEACVSCLGSARDEVLCEQVVDVLVGRGCSTHLSCKRAAKRRRKEDITDSRSLTLVRRDADERQRASGRSVSVLPINASGEEVLGVADARVMGARARCTRSIHPAHVSQWPAIRTLRQARLANYKPAMTVSRQVAEKLAAVTAHGEVQGLPAFVVRQRSVEVAGSVARARFQQWLLSEQGAEWRKVRADRLQAAAADDDLEEELEDEDVAATS